MNLFKITTLAIFFTLNACGVDSFNSEIGEGSALTNIDIDSSGEQLSASQASIELDQYCLPENQGFIMEMSNYAFNAGYQEHFAGSGYRGLLSASDDTSCLSPSGSGEMYSLDQMGMHPPSQDSCLNDIYKNTCDILNKSLEGEEGYASVTARKGASASGKAAGIDVNQENCLTFDLAEPRNGYQATIAYCGDSFITTGTISIRGSSSNEMALYLYQ